jgi:hypothetical protein
MLKTKAVLLTLAVLFLGWIFLFQVIQPVSSSPLLGITLTPTLETPKATFTPIVPTKPPVPTLPPPPPGTTPEAPILIPVTGSDKSANLDGVINLGLIVAACGLIYVGLSKRKK